MITAADYIKSARHLLMDANSEASRRRAVSTAYYALFHTVCFHFANLVEYPSDGSWNDAYRQIDHGPAKQRCSLTKRELFPDGIVQLAVVCVALQEARIRADYRPDDDIDLQEAQSLVLSAETALTSFDRASTQKQRTFVLFVSLKPRTR